jgi:phospholipid transport system substrate-binding protein
MGEHMRTTVASFMAVLAAVVLLGSPTPARADAELDQAVQKTLKALVGSIRYGKDDMAARQVAFGGMGQALLTEEWQKLSAAEQAEIARGLETCIRALSFSKGREMFKYLDALLFEPARLDGNTAKVKSTIVVHRELKKAEIIIDWVLTKDAGSWKVLDIVMMGESTLAGLRDEQVKPLLTKGGKAAVLQALRDKVAEVTKKT